jgi:hypothetical protein
LDALSKSALAKSYCGDLILKGISVESTVK